MRCRSIIKPKAKIMLVGEAPGQEEEKFGIPFVGYTGKELTAAMNSVGISRASVSITNVFLDRPPGNNLLSFCDSKKNVTEEALDYGWNSYDLAPPKSGGYIKPYYALELIRLKGDIIAADPNIIIALGNVALWALCGVTQITKYRGAITESKLVPGVKVLPTFHPSYFCRDWSARPIVLADLMKAKVEQEFKEIRRPNRYVNIPTELEDIQWFRREEIESCELLSFDIETAGNEFITSVALATDPSLVLVIPFIKDDGRYVESYWTPETEPKVWRELRGILESPIPKLAQNGLYDIQFLLEAGIAVRNYKHDTMLLHHALQPRLQKGLAFQSSIYTNEASWKTMRPRRKKSLKSDE